MQSLRCPSCGKGFLLDTQELVTTGVAAVLRGRRGETTLPPRVLRQTMRVNVICPYCDFEFLISVEEHDEH